MRQVKCQITKEYGNSSDFYCVINDKGKKKYYKSQQIYEEYLVDQKQKELTVNYILDLLNYDHSACLLKKLKGLAESYSYNVILETFNQNEDLIKYYLNGKLAETKEYPKIGYIFAIINSKINDVQKDIQIQDRQEEKQSRDIDFDIDGFNSIGYVKIKSKDISLFLEGDKI